jgi:hypothetical protein
MTFSKTAFDTPITSGTKVSKSEHLELVVSLPPVAGFSICTDQVVGIL